MNIKHKKCIICNKDFTAKGNSKTCSKECGKLNIKKTSKVYCSRQDVVARRKEQESSGKWSSTREKYHSNPENRQKKTDRLHTIDGQRKNRESNWKWRGIKDMTVEKYNTMLSSQNNCCCICGRHMSEFKYNLAVDHDHSTGRARGLLCNNCNNGLGRFQDDIDILASAISYLQQK
jgi:hypothetical protein